MFKLKIELENEEVCDGCPCLNVTWHEVNCKYFGKHIIDRNDYGRKEIKRLDICLKN